MELMVAAVITAVIVGFIVAIVSKVSGFWTRTSGKLSAGAQARHVLDQLTLDLSSAAYRDDGNVWMAVDVLNNSNGGATNLWQIAAANAKPVGGVSLAMNASTLSTARFGTAGVASRRNAAVMRPPTRLHSPRPSRSDTKSSVGLALQRPSAQERRRPPTSSIVPKPVPRLRTVAPGSSNRATTLPRPPTPRAPPPRTMVPPREIRAPSKFRAHALISRQ